MTFEEWVEETFPTHGDTIDTSKIPNFHFIEEAFEAGYNACKEDWKEAEDFQYHNYIEDYP